MVRALHSLLLTMVLQYLYIILGFSLWLDPSAVTVNAVSRIEAEQNAYLTGARLSNTTDYPYLSCKPIGCPPPWLDPSQLVDTMA